MGKLASCILDFKREYLGVIPLEIRLKLDVLVWHDNGAKPKVIKEKLKQNYKKKVKQDLLAPYLRDDNKKISRIVSKCKETSELPRIIGIDNLVKIIVKKYPFPLTAGVPYYNWTEQVIKEYTYVLFYIPESREGVLSLQTVKNSLYNLHLKHYNLYSVLEYYFFSEKIYNFYYLSRGIITYPISEKDKKNSEIIRRYNKSMMPILFKIDEDDIAYSTLRSIAYNADFMIYACPLLDKFKKKILNNKREISISGENPVFIMKKYRSMDYELISDNALVLLYKNSKILEDLNNLAKCASNETTKGLILRTSKNLKIILDIDEKECLMKKCSKREDVPNCCEEIKKEINTDIDEAKVV